MACAWHDYDEKPHLCSLAKIKCWAYVISKHCCEDFGIPLLSGRHRPSDSSTLYNGVQEKTDVSRWIRLPASTDLYVQLNF